MKTSEVISEIRKHLDLSQEDFGDEIGVGQSAIANYETGRRIPERRVARRMEAFAKKHGLPYTIDDLIPEDTA